MRYIIILFCMLILCGCKDSNNSIDNRETNLKYRGGVEIKIVDDESCMRWALGDDYGSLSRSQLDDVWNKKHRDIFMIKSSDDYNESIRRIKNVCRERKIDARTKSE